MASINLLLQSKKNPSVIYIRLRDGRTLDIKAKTNYHIDPSNWDEVTQRPLKRLLKVVDFANLDTDLATLKNDLLKEYNISKGIKVINTLWLKDFLNPTQVEKKYPDILVDYIDTFIELKKNDIRKPTIVKCNVIKHLLERYQKQTKSILYIRNIDSKFKSDFEKYCISVGYAPTTTARNI
ncbi:MAG: phage integrase SAM-like domain-containing protein, partial [Saprospiraceae bacterium]|nr:phage integrase SAM-like domain-containing protein [Saprospiraceae bacterium]